MEHFGIGGLVEDDRFGGGTGGGDQDFGDALA
jgi:hypothetical protein